MPLRKPFVAALVLIAVARAAAATTYVPMSDRDLAEGAAAIARVRVLGEQPGPVDRPPATDYLVAVDRLLQGHLPGGTIVVRVPGGMRADGLVHEVAGAPRLRQGAEALLFLQPGEDGTFGPLHLALGAFHARRAGTGAFAEQDLAGAHPAGPPPHGEDGRVRDLERFTAWLEDRGAGSERPADYWVRRTGGPRARVEKAHTPLPTSDGVAPRWFDFETGWSASWVAHAAGQPGMGVAATATAIEAALAAWSADATSAIGLRYAGTTPVDTGIGTPDRLNAFLFGDPHGQVPGTFDCNKGGVLAMGGPYYWSSLRSYRGNAYHEIVEADVVTNDGADCYLAKDPKRAAEVFAHEVGHALGFGHATDAEALMWPSAHGHGRGARLGEDDRVGASLVYGDGSYRPAPPAPGPTPAGSFTLRASTGRTEVRLSWTHGLQGVEGFRVESQRKKKGFGAVLTVPGDASGALLTGLKPNQTLTLRVIALRAGGAVAGATKPIRVRTLR